VSSGPSTHLAALDRRIDDAKREALRIYRPMKGQISVHASTAHELVVYGGKRSGKSTSAAAEVASRMTGLPVIGPDGNALPHRWPVSTPEDPHTYWIVGIDVTHIGKTVHRLLFQKGMGGKFRAIRDLQTGDWRAYNKADPSDLARHSESRLTSGMIPSRMIPGPKAWAWKRQRSHEFLSVKLVNGATIYAFPSSSRTPAMGDAVDGIWINEDILFPEYISEWQDRLNDTDGWFIWDAFPQMYNDVLGELLGRADEEEGKPEPAIQSVQLVYDENEYINEATKDRALGRMGDDESIARRNRGELLTSMYSIYDFFPALHLLQRRDPDELEPYQPVAIKPSPVRDVLENHYGKYGRFPAEWTRYLAIDPAHSRTAILSLVITPWEFNQVLLRHRRTGHRRSPSGEAEDGPM